MINVVFAETINDELSTRIELFGSDPGHLVDIKVSFLRTARDHLPSVADGELAGSELWICEHSSWFLALLSDLRNILSIQSPITELWVGDLVKIETHVQDCESTQQTHLSLDFMISQSHKSNNF